MKEYNILTYWRGTGYEYVLFEDNVDDKTLIVKLGSTHFPIWIILGVEYELII